MDGLRAWSARTGGSSSAAELCPFRARYGVDCLGCGGTRAFVETAHGHVAEGFRRNPIGAVSGLIIWAAVLAALAALATDRTRPLLAWLVVALPLLTVTVAARALLWWRALPPGLVGP